MLSLLAAYPVKVASGKVQMCSSTVLLEACGEFKLYNFRHYENGCKNSSVQFCQNAYRYMHARSDLVMYIVQWIEHFVMQLHNYCA